jgi:hypothetical protein
MERLYLKVVGGYATVYHRPTHALIEFLPDPDTKEAKDRVIELIKMPQDEFYRYIFTKGIKPRKKLIEDKNKEQEDWYYGAWKTHTERFIKKHNITVPIPDEDIPYELIEELKSAGKTGWNLGTKKEPEKPKEEPKKPLKKLPTKKPKLSPMEELEKQFKAGGMSLREYITQKKVLAKA